MQEGIGYKGNFELNLIRDGRIIDQRKINNTLLDTGKTWLIVRTFDDHGSASVSGTAAHAFYVGITTSNDAVGVQAGDTTGNTNEIGREAFVYATGATVGRMSGTATFVSATANGAIRECGIFAGATTSGDGAFIARALFTAVNKTSNDTLQIKYDVSFA